MIPASKIDTQDMWGATFSLPEQMAAAVSAVPNGGAFARGNHVDHVVVVGMGGSGIAGDVAVAAAAPFMSVPITVVKGYDIPTYVSARSLVIAVSFSGNTEEVREAVQVALHQGAQVVGISSGGDLEEIVRKGGGYHIGVDPSIPQPRAAFGALSVSVLAVLDRVGLFGGATQWVHLAVEQLKKRRDELVLSGSLAERLGLQLVDRIPLFVSAGAVGTVAAMRWKCEVNENAKAPAFFAIYPEACHNELAGFEGNADLLKDRVVMVVLRHAGEHPQIGRRYAFAQRLLAPRLAGFESVIGQGEGDLASLFDLTFIGDVASLWLAEGMGVDPGPIPVLVDMKAAVAGGV